MNLESNFVCKALPSSETTAYKQWKILIRSPVSEMFACCTSVASIRSRPTDRLQIPRESKNCRPQFAFWLLFAKDRGSEFALSEIL